MDLEGKHDFKRIDLAFCSDDDDFLGFDNTGGKDKGKSVPLEPRRGPEGSRKLRFPDFVITAQDGRRLSALRTGSLYPQEILLVIISVRGITQVVCCLIGYSCSWSKANVKRVMLIICFLSVCKINNDGLEVHETVMIRYVCLNL